MGGTLLCLHLKTFLERHGNHETVNQIDHIIMYRRWNISLQDVRVYRRADMNTDHHLLVVKIKLARLKQKRTNPMLMFDTGPGDKIALPERAL